jgi:hypothetical protein
MQITQKTGRRSDAIAVFANGRMANGRIAVEQLAISINLSVTSLKEIGISL